MNFKQSTLAWVALLWAGAGAQAQDANEARALAAICSTCHGTEGRSVGGVPPSLAGQKRENLLQALREFRDGRRAATVMTQQAKGLTDAEMGLLADYFSTRRP